MREESYGNLSVTKYSYTRKIYKNLWAVRKDDSLLLSKTGVIDNMGDIVVSFDFDEILGVTDGKIKVRLDDKEFFYEKV